MADPSSYRPKPGQIPDSPGVYKFRDEHRRVIYVGKAKSLRQRLASYFQDLANLHPRTRTMVTTAASVEWTVVSTEVEALQLEYSWIKEYDPRFNVKYRDDKSYPYLAVTMNEEFPRVQVMRGHKKKGVRYFGPYGHAWAIRDTVDLLLRVFPVRTCSAGVFKNASRTGKPCLLGYIGKCSAPCVGRVSSEEHRDLAEEFCDFMAGRTGTYIRRQEQQMTDAAEEMEYERAARLRDDIEALKKAMEKSAVVLADATDADLMAVAEDELEAAVQIFHVRGGRVRGQRGWVTDKVEAVTTGDLVEHALQQLYGEETGDSVPKEVLVPALPEPVEPVQEWLTERRGSNVSLRIPQRGDKKALMETVRRNALQSLALHKTRRASDLTTRSRALEEIAEALDLDSAPLRIECYDISHLQGDDVVASMVVFEDGLQRKGEYRRFQIKGFMRPGRRPLHARGDHAPLQALPRGEGEDGGVDGRRGHPSGAVRDPHVRQPADGGARRGDHLLRDRARGDHLLRDPARGGRLHRDRPFRCSPPRERLLRGGRPSPSVSPTPAARRRRRWPAAGGRRPAGPRGTRYRRHRRLRTRQAPGGGVAARRERSGGPAAHQRGPVPAPAGPGRGPPLRDHLPARQAGQTLPGGPPGRRTGPGRLTQTGTDQTLRLREETPVRDDRPDLRGPRHRAEDGGDHRRGPRRGGSGRTRREHGHWRDHGRRRTRGARDDCGPRGGARDRGHLGRATGAGDMTENDAREEERPAQGTEEHGTASEDHAEHEAPREDGAQVGTGIETAGTGVPDAAIPELVIISGMSG